VPFKSSFKHFLQTNFDNFVTTDFDSFLHISSIVLRQEVVRQKTILHVFIFANFCAFQEVKHFDVQMSTYVTFYQAKTSHCM